MITPLSELDGNAFRSQDKITSVCFVLSLTYTPGWTCLWNDGIVITRLSGLAGIPVVFLLESCNAAVFWCWRRAWCLRAGLFGLRICKLFRLGLPAGDWSLRGWETRCRKKKSGSVIDNKRGLEKLKDTPFETFNGSLWNL